MPSSFPNAWPGPAHPEYSSSKHIASLQPGHGLIWCICRTIEPPPKKLSDADRRRAVTKAFAEQDRARVAARMLHHDGSDLQLTGRYRKHPTQSTDREVDQLASPNLSWAPACQTSDPAVAVRVGPDQRVPDLLECAGWLYTC